MKAGDVQWMTAGKGLLHREMAYNKKPVHTLQLWVNLSADKKMIDPPYHDLRRDQVPVRPKEGKGNGLEIRVFSGRSGNVKGPETVANRVPITMSDVIIKKKEHDLIRKYLPAKKDLFLSFLDKESLERIQHQ